MIKIVEALSQVSKFIEAKVTKSKTENTTHYEANFNFSVFKLLGAVIPFVISDLIDLIEYFA